MTIEDIRRASALERIAVALEKQASIQERIVVALEKIANVEPASIDVQSRIVARFAQPEATEPQSIDCYAVGADQLRATAQELERMATEFYDSQEGDQ